jgi:hypothetical protein
MTARDPHAIMDGDRPLEDFPHYLYHLSEADSILALNGVVKANRATQRIAHSQREPFSKRFHAALIRHNLSPAKEAPAFDQHERMCRRHQMRLRVASTRASSDYVYMFLSAMTGISLADLHFPLERWFWIGVAR